MRHALAEHAVETEYERGWARLNNGDLIATAEAAGFAVFVTTHKSLKYQQNPTGLKLAIVVLQTTSWPRIQRALPTVVAAIDAAMEGSYAEVEVA